MKKVKIKHESRRFDKLKVNPINTIRLIFVQNKKI